MTSKLVSITVGAILSIALEIVPGLSSLWENWAYKRAAWLVGCLVVPLAMMGLCYAGAPVGFECSGPFIWDGLWAALSAAFAAYFAGQMTYSLVLHKAGSKPCGKYQ